MLNTMQFVLQR